MDISEISELFKKIKRAYPMFSLPQEYKLAQEMVLDWHDFLANIPFATAQENLRRYVLDPDNKYPPHPGALARPLNQRTDADRYHSYMRAAGITSLEEWEQMRKRAVPPPPDQRERVKRYGRI